MKYQVKCEEDHREGKQASMEEGNIAREEMLID